MKKKSVYTNITPIPSHIPRQLAVDMLHSHGEIIELNPLVIGYKPIKAPQTAPADEFFSTWYEINERIQYVPGIGRAGAGKISFKGCFHDMPWGLQTHVYAPMGVDLRNKWQIRGNQPGEPPESRELGSNAPPEGLYLREDIEIKCNPAMVSFVKKEMKAASKTMVDRLVKKAELIDSGVLSAMFEEGRLKTMNPADRSQTYQQQGHDPSQTFLQQDAHRSQTFQPQGHYSPSLLSPMPQSAFPQSPSMPGFPQSAYARQSSYGMPSPSPQPQPQHAQMPPAQGLAIEMPGNTHFLQQPPPQMPHRFSTAMSELSASSPNQTDFPHQSSQSDRQSYAESMSSMPSSVARSGGMASPGLEKRTFVAELPANNGSSVPERSPRRSPDPNYMSAQQQQQQYRYNPQDYARMS
ncbi:hypothetical protein A1O7_02956 [Cladophialophora yegresii CBS 114405]|uniref:DUF7053 domain-containing protein n=1 Tax=Cladophialophora yegresii CBS 114405 TaxID=1182544 RepID=W9W3J5_9EURO|nr:uncharacterized protein A1O7_02956 [Cladophialophora yegresii CBS 114405]EXJ62518.1 hypothetical protein A1O7_02956 [Cladophialophora yegresii CBS 114405]